MIYELRIEGRSAEQFTRRDEALKRANHLLAENVPSVEVWHRQCTLELHDNDVVRKRTCNTCYTYFKTENDIHWKGEGDPPRIPKQRFDFESVEEVEVFDCAWCRRSQTGASWMSVHNIYVIPRITPGIPAVVERFQDLNRPVHEGPPPPPPPPPSLGTPDTSHASY